MKTIYPWDAGWPWRACVVAMIVVSGQNLYSAEPPAAEPPAAETPAAEEPAPTEEVESASAEGEVSEEYRNWIETSFGSTFINGDDPSYKRRYGLPRGAFGGLEDLHVEDDIGTRGLIELDGRAIFDIDDYDFRLTLSHPDQGYLRAGYREFRTYYDGSGGFFPRNDQWFRLNNEDFEIDRGEAWIEGGLLLPGWPELRLKYSHQFREGTKNSTIWGDTGLTTLAGPNNIRGIVPTFLNIDEQRNILEGDVKHTFGNTDLGAGLRYEISDLDNSRNIHRRPNEAQDRFVTQHEGVDSDLFNVHAFSETRFSERILFTTGYSFTTLDTDITGSRIYGEGYDPIYDPVYARRQQRDEGFLDLGGGANMKQHVANVNLMLRPWQHITIVPSLRIEHQDQDGVSRFTETDIGAAPGFIASQADLVNRRERDFTDVTEALEARYTGITNWAFYVRGEWLQGQGDLEETETEAQTGLVSRETDSTRFLQKYSVGANWYPLRKLNLGGQYYFKRRQNDYDHDVDSTLNAPPNGDRYPAFLRDQDFDTHDMNVRVTWRALNNLTFVTRYDFQLSTIDTRGDFLSEVESAESTAHIISENISWTPLPRLYLQGSINYVLDTTETPASDAISGVDLVLDAQNSYWNTSILVGYALGMKTDLQTQYLYYRADNYEDNSSVTQPYGAEAEEHGVVTTLIHRFSKRLQWTLRYGFFANHDKTSGGQNDYTAHLAYTSLRLAF